MRAFFILIIASLLTGCFARSGKLLSDESKEASVKLHTLELKSESYYESSKEESFQAFDSLKKETLPDGTSITKIYGGVKTSGISKSKHEASNQVTEQKIDSAGKENKKAEEQISTGVNTVNESTVAEAKNLFIWIFAVVIAGALLYFLARKKHK